MPKEEEVGALEGPLWATIPCIWEEIICFRIEGEEKEEDIEDLFDLKN